MVQLPTVVEVATEYGLDLEWSGKRYRASCPFHEENTPSFIITEDEKHFHCFGCGVDGGVLDFISLWEGVPLDAVKARYYGKVARKDQYSLGSLKRKLRTAAAPPAVYAEIRATVAELTRRAYSAWRQWDAAGRQELKRQRRTAAYTVAFHKLFTREQLWEAFWEAFEEIMGLLISHSISPERATEKLVGELKELNHRRAYERV